MKIKGKDIRLYAVSDRQWSENTEEFLKRIEDCLKNGVTMLQLREKNTSYDEFRTLAQSVKPLCRKYGVKFIINDNVTLAKEVDADGVHIGQGDGSVIDARKILGDDKIIGVSSHNVEEAVKAQREGADYLGCGAAFGTSTKNDAGAIKHSVIADITHSVDIPVIAIGGINSDNITRLENLGLDGVAVVSAIFAADDTTKATKKLRQQAEKVAEGSNK